MGRHTKTIATAALTAICGTNAALAGGLEANGYNWDFLFDSEAYAARGTITHVMIDQDIRNAAGDTVAESANRVYYNYAVKADLTDAASCLVSVQNPWGSGTDRDFTYAATTSQAVEERVFSNDVGLTCSYGFEVGPGTLSAIGGVSGQSLDYEADIAFAPLVPLLGEDALANIDISGTGIGWRAGLAYEIPEMALRVTAIYNAPVDYELSGEAFGGLAPFVSAVDGIAEVTTPQTFELRAQSGIAPGWLVLGSVKWVDWSVLDVLTVETDGPLPDVSTTLNYEDGWTVSAGVGHALTEELSLLGTVTWDKGTSREDGDGFLEDGTQSDRWALALGASYEVADQLELSGGVSYSIIESGENARGESWDTGSVLALSASLKASF
jgi:long-chain fatty acid transport protein